MRILTVRLGRAGDMVMITPALKVLIEHFPDAEFTLLTSPDGRRLLGNYHPRLKNIWLWNRSAFGSSLKKPGLKKKIKAANFDKIICFETSMSIINMLPGPQHGTGPELYWQSGNTEIQHSAREYLDLAGKACSKTFGDVPVNLPVSTESTRLVDEQLAVAGIHKNDLVIALHPTFSGYSRFNLRKRNTGKHKLWPAESFAELAQRLSQLKLSNGASPKIVIDLLDDEMRLGKKIEALSHHSVILLNEKPDINRYKAFLHRADLLVSPDTGPMHIAAAVGTRIVALFSGKDPAQCGPYTRPGLFTVLTSASQPELGIAAIKVDDVFNACIKQLEHSRAEPASTFA